MGVSWTALADGYPSLMIGRFVTGIGVGFGLAIDPVYIAEVSPPQFRGQLVTWSETATNVGILLGFIAGFVFKDLPRSYPWRVMLGCGTILPGESIRERAEPLFRDSIIPSSIHHPRSCADRGGVHYYARVASVAGRQWTRGRGSSDPVALLRRGHRHERVGG